MAKAILIKPSNELWRRIREAASQDKRKPGPMVLILLERYFGLVANGQAKEGQQS